ncbi:hypothetical protein NL108_011479 [Boleophthalmus pectinirostris]|nr:hypothetical protein NL108_011479 [Boleophthalmus pectinirostris]
MELFKEALKKLFTQVQQNLSLYVTIIVTASYHLAFEKDFACSCKPENQQHSACMMHLFLPVALLWVILLLRDKCFQCICFKECCKTYMCALCVRVVLTLCVSTIWVAAVFIDGDWWLCCCNNGTEIQATVACKPPSQRSTEEKSIASDLQSRSRVSHGLLTITP